MAYQFQGIESKSTDGNWKRGFYQDYVYCFYDCYCWYYSFILYSGFFGFSSRLCTNLFEHKITANIEFLRLTIANDSNDDDGDENGFVWSMVKAQSGYLCFGKWSSQKWYYFSLWFCLFDHNFASSSRCAILAYCEHLTFQPIYYRHNVRHMPTAIALSQPQMLLLASWFGHAFTIPSLTNA